MITNEGNGYDSTTGMFTCSKPGLYFFTHTVKQSGLEAMYHGASGTLMVNGISKVGSVVCTFHTDQHLQGTNSVIVRLEEGDEVWIRGGGLIEGNMNATTFTGFWVAQ